MALIRKAMPFSSAEVIKDYVDKQKSAAISDATNSAKSYADENFAAASHTHNYAGSSSAGGSATSAVKLATARYINGMAFDGSANRMNYGTCSTAAATAAKVVSCTGFSLSQGAGAEITVKFTVTNTAANPTLNVNSTGAKAIYYQGAAITAGYLAAGHIYTFRYNGTQYELVGDVVPTLATVATSGKYSDLSGTPSSLPASDTTSTYSSTGTAPVNGKAVLAAIQTLDVSSVGGSGKYIQSISETDGKISATAATMPTTLPANGGDADTVNGHTVAADVPSDAKFTDTVYTHPSYTAATGVPTANATPAFGGTFSVNQVSRDATGHVSALTSRTITIPGTAASESAAGLVTTGAQTFAGSKFVKTDRFGLMMSGVTKGTAPSSNQYARIQFQDNSGSTADTANLGMIYHSVTTANESQLVMRATKAYDSSTDSYYITVHKTSSGEGYADVRTPTSSARSCLRNLSSGTAAATTTNCPSGAWYGQHS